MLMSKGVPLLDEKDLAVRRRLKAAGHDMLNGIWIARARGWDIARAELHAQRL